MSSWNCVCLCQFVKAASWSTFSTATDALRAASWSTRHNPFTTSGMACKSLLVFWCTSSSLFVLGRDSWQPHRQVNSSKSRKTRYVPWHDFLKAQIPKSRSTGVLSWREVNVCFFFPCRPDRQLQDIVYKMVPFLEERERSDAVHTHYIYVHEKLVIRYFLLSGAVEREQMRNFYKSRGLEVPNPGKPVQPWRSFFFLFLEKKIQN